MDTTEASTMDALSTANSFWSNLSRLRNQLGVVIGGAGSAWNAAVQMIPLSQKGAASGVVGLSANSLPQLRNGGTPTVTVGGAAGTGGTASVNAGSTDACGVLTVATGTGPVAGVQATLSFSTTLAAAPKLVLVSYFGNNIGPVASTDTYTTTSFQLKSTALAASTTYQFLYLVIP